MSQVGPPLLELEGVDAFYGRAHVLFGISLAVRRGEIVVLLGRNGAGKSTTFKSIAGLVAATGPIRLHGRDIRGLPPHRIARLGVGYVPEDRQIFPNLTVADNLEIAAKPGADGSVHWTLARLESVFPLLGALLRREGGSLSGGEQQLVTIARTLMGNPDVLLLDEPSEGLAPVLVKTLATLVERLRAEDMSVLLSEQNVRFALRVSERAYIIDSGRIPYEGSVKALREEPEIMKRYLAV
ncbi:MAG: ABC transporter ATP-binding protein [Candidatus Rokubacteria bacterium]|nr:ABC transporter ATP-binding protein [Candidatus Rokubacteria bacterium]